MKRKTTPLFVIADYPYGRKHPAMYLLEWSNSKDHSKWTFRKENAIQFPKELAEIVAKKVKGVVEKCS